MTPGNRCFFIFLGGGGRKFCSAFDIFELPDEPFLAEFAEPHAHAY
jgi:hypothetical protein